MPQMKWYSVARTSIPDREDHRSELVAQVREDGIKSTLSLTRPTFPLL